MRLSEAIRLGATMKPQAFGSLFNGVGTCAFGAAYDAIGLLRGFQHGTITWQAVFAEHSWPIIRPESCPVPGCMLAGTIIHLNDNHRWSREKIADYVELFERTEAPEELPDPIPQPEEAPLEVA